MTLVSTPAGLYFPENLDVYKSVQNAVTLNAATDKFCMVGHVYWDARAASKVVSSAGGQIKFLSGTSNTFANAGTSIDVGIQDVDTANGPAVRGDGTYDVKGTLVGATDTIADSTAKAVNMSTGSKTIAHGDFVAVMITVVSRGGADSVQIANVTGPSNSGGGLIGRPVCSQFKSSAWTTNGAVPDIIIVADDGTLGVFDAAVPILNANSETLSDSTNPDERALIFQVPWECKIDAIFAYISGNNGAGSDGTFSVYSDPTGSPSVLSGSQVSFLGRNFERNGTLQWFEVMFASEISLSADTDYAVALKATGSGNISLGYVTLLDTNARKFMNGSTTLKKATRNNSSGAFTAEATPLIMYQMGVRISSFHKNSIIYPRSGLQGINEGMAR